MDGGFGPLVLIALVVIGCIVGVLFVVAFVVFVILGAVGVMSIKDRVGRAKRLADEAGPEDAW